MRARVLGALIWGMALGVGTAAFGQTTNLLPSRSFERGQGRPEGWQVSLGGGAGRWEQGGHEGERSISVAGTGENELSWQTPVRLGANQLYHTSFWVRRTAGTDGVAISGLSAVNRDFLPGPEWEEREFFFRTPAQMAGVMYRLGQWHVAGTVAFDQASLAPAFAVYARPEDGGLLLGEGESVTAGRYACEHRLGGPGASDHRALESFTAGFNTNRWVFSTGSQVTYRHELGRMEQTNEKVEVSVNYWTKGRLVLEASADGEEWAPVGVVGAVGRWEFKVPFPRARKVWVRLRGEGECDLQVDGYRYEAKVPSAWRVARAVGATHYFCVRYATPELTATVSGAGLRGVGDNSLDLTLQSVNWRRKVEAAVSFLQQNREVARDRTELVLKPARTVPVSLKFRTLAAGRGVLHVSVRDADRHQLLWEAQATCQVPLLYDARGGEALAANDALSVWWCEPERRVSRNRPAPTERGVAVRIQAAGNEYEAAQVVFTPRQELRQCRLVPGPLTGPKGAVLPASEIEARWVEYVFTDQPTDGLGAVDEWPDPLPLAREPRLLPRNRNQPCWVTVHVPAGTPAGNYAGDLTLTAEGLTQRVPLSVHVWGFDLPKETHLRSGFGLDRAALKTYHHLETEEQVQQVWELYLRDFARHRVCPYSVGRTIGVDWEKGAGGQVVPRLDFAGFDRDAQFALDELGFNSFRLSLQGLGGGTFHSRHPGRIAGFEQGTPEYEAAFRVYAKAVQDHLEEKGWLKQAYLYWFDEPSEQDTEFVKQGMELLGRAAPKLTRLLTTAPRPALYDTVDLWCLPTYQLDAEVVKQRQAAGEKAWWSLCTAPKEPHFGLFLDHYGTEMRLWGWETWKYGLDGLLVWDTAYWTSSAAYPDTTLQNPWQDPMSWASGYDTPRLAKRPWGNGDGRFLYPPARDVARERHPFLEGPVPSIRWELLRDGIEDYEYVWLLRAEVDRRKAAGADPATYREAEKLLEVPAEVCAGLTQFATTPEPIQAQREKVARAIEELGGRE